MNDIRVILAGGGGFLGRILSRHFVHRGWEIVVLTRTPKPAATGFREVVWDGETLGDWTRELEGADAVINLAGRSVNCRYHARNRREILDSRVQPTRVLGEAIARCSNPPKAWLNASTATIYRHTFGPAWDENGETGGTPEAKDEFSVEVAMAWEREFDHAPTPRTRKAALRSAMVLGHAKNSVLPMLRRLVKLGLGGKMADGRQFVSWIHQDDFCRAVEWILDREDVGGPINLASPNPLSNAEMMDTLCKVWRRPFGLPAARWMLEAGAFLLGTETELVIKSRRVIPGRLLESGFQFRYPRLEDAVRSLERQKATG